MKALPVVLSIVLVASVAVAQDAPLTQNEADISIKKAYTHLKQVLDLPASKFTVSLVKNPLSRDQYVGRLYAMYEYIKPKVQPRVRPVAVDTKGMTPGLTAEHIKQLKTLVAYGLVAKDSLLVSSPRTKYTPKEFGKILGNFLTRSMEITHVLDPKYSPELMPN